MMTDCAPGIQQNEEIIWYAFYSEAEQREFYFEPVSGVSSWILPDGAHGQTKTAVLCSTATTHHHRVSLVGTKKVVNRLPTKRYRRQEPSFVRYL
jgi:hypothetical protein